MKVTDEQADVLKGCLGRGCVYAPDDNTEREGMAPEEVIYELVAKSLLRPGERWKQYVLTDKGKMLTKAALNGEH